MEANNYISKLKANGNSKDYYDLASAYKEYKSVNTSLPTKDRGTFSLNVLCILCRNLEKAPSWRDRIDCKSLLTLSIDCVRDTRGMTRPDRIKTLASIYYIHKHVVKQNTNLPPELVLKISYMAFENDTNNLFKEHEKTYWGIITDRLTYLEKLKTKANITKLATKLTEDLLKIIEIYDTKQFCVNILSYLIKKLHLLYNENDAKLLHKIYLSIFEKLSNKSAFKNLSETELFDVYFKLNDCFYVVAENAAKINFKDSPLDVFVRCVITMVGHDASLFHILQTFYLNAICCILTYKRDEKYVERILEGLLKCFESTEKLGYVKAMKTTYPFINQLLRLFVEKNEILNIQTQENILKIILYLMEKLCDTKQLLKCENCKSPTGLHDALKLSFLVKNILSSIKCNLEMVLPISYEIIQQQYKTYNELKRLKCANNAKYFRKLQTDVHNLAIGLNKDSYNDSSVKLFKIYLTHEIANYNDINDAKNISRALYNKSICEMDAKMYSEALNDAYLSLLFNLSDTQTDKHMNLVMDIKAKAVKNGDDGLQLRSVLEACKIALDSDLYGNIRGFLVDVKFSEVLRHEFTMYAKSWPSMVPVGGVWCSLWDLYMGRHSWMHAEKPGIYRVVLSDIILETTQCVRNLHCKHYLLVINELIREMEENGTTEIDENIFYASLLFLKAEIELCEASDKYGWKGTDTNTELDKVQYTRTIAQEHEAIKPAFRAVDVWSGLVDRLDGATPHRLRLSLQVACVFVYQFLHLHYIKEGLELAYVCCKVSRHIDDKDIFLHNTGILLYHIEDGCDELNCLLSVGTAWCQDVTSETTLMFICEAAIHYTRRGEVGSAARLVRMAQSWVLNAHDKCTDVNLDLGVGRLLEAQYLLCKGSGPTILTALNGIQRHYLSITNTGVGWCSRRQRGLSVRWAAVLATVAAHCSPPTSRRAPVAPACPATPAARLHCCATHTSSTHDAQVKIDNCLKHILGLQSNNENLQQNEKNTSKITNIVPQVETMLDSQIFRKNQTSPSTYFSVPAFRIPEYFNHNNCDCFACKKPSTLILACKTMALEASMYFRSKELLIAENYFQGALKMIEIAEKKCFVDNQFITKYIKNKYMSELKLVQIELLIELCYFEMVKGRNDQADDHIVTIHEITQEFRCDEYVSNEIMNLVTASATMKNVRKSLARDLELDFEAMKLSPSKTKTPESKKMPDNTTKVTIKDEDVMKIRKVIKLNLDVEEKNVKLKPQFKVPSRLTNKPVLENITPKPRPRIKIQQPTIEVTPKITPAEEFFTPSTPEQFFTPMTSIKTYSKLCGNVVKNLEMEFLTPVGKEIEKKGRHLRRAVSPGKLPEKVERPRRTRKPVFSDK